MFRFVNANALTQIDALHDDKYIKVFNICNPISVSFNS